MTAAWKWNSKSRVWTAELDGVALVAHSVETTAGLRGRRKADPMAWRWTAGEVTGHARTGDLAKDAAEAAARKATGDGAALLVSILDLHLAGGGE